MNNQANQSLWPLKEFLFIDDLMEQRLVRSDTFPLLVIGSYVLFSVYVGPTIMRHRLPFNLRKTLFIYNGALVFISLYLATMLGYYNWNFNRSHHCPTDKLAMKTRIKNEQQLYVWHLYLSKYLEMLDTLFFVMRKKSRQLTTLHIVHHSCTPLILWLGIKFDPTATYGLAIMALNCAVHVVMYTYYALSTLGSSVQKYLWWKKYLTTIQIAQFVVQIMYVSVMFAIGCIPFNTMTAATVCFITLVLFMFLKFYKQSFSEKKTH